MKRHPIHFFFSLQFRRLNRQLKAAGVHPLFLYGLAPVVFVFVSIIFFQKLDYAAYVYPFIALALLNGFGNIDRTRFLQNTFRDSDFRKIRLIENTAVVFPFVLFLLYRQAFPAALSLVLAGTGLSFFNKARSRSFVIPTPFYRWPFEFTAGFRHTFWVFMLTYLLAVIAIRVGNFNLGVFALLLTFLTSMSFYSQPEQLAFVWIHCGNAAVFLKDKMKIALRYGLYLSLPQLAGLIVFFPERAPVLLAFEALGLAYILTSLLSKYSFYPSEVNVIQGIAIATGIVFPPVLAVLLPYLYYRSKKNLNLILDDHHQKP